MNYNRRVFEWCCLETQVLIFLKICPRFMRGWVTKSGSSYVFYGENERIEFKLSHVQRVILWNNRYVVPKGNCKLLKSLPLPNINNHDPSLPCDDGQPF